MFTVGASEQFNFMKNVNSNLTKSEMLKIQKAVERYMPTLYEYLDNSQNSQIIYMQIATESTFVKTARSNDIGGLNRGLMQVQKDTYYYLVKKGIIKDEWGRITEIDYNIKIGMIILKQKFNAVRKFNPKNTREHLFMALIAYNKGEGKLREDIFIDKRRDFHNFKYIKTIMRKNRFLKTKYAYKLSQERYDYEEFVSRINDVDCGIVRIGGISQI
jgi:soluble lytic murein transglycosylase-like protein